MTEVLKYILLYLLGIQQSTVYYGHQYLYEEYYYLTFKHNLLYPPFLLFDIIELLHKFTCTVKISFPVIL